MNHRVLGIECDLVWTRRRVVVETDGEPSTRRSPAASATAALLAAGGIVPTLVAARLK